MDKKRKIPRGRLRLFIQCAFAALNNGYLQGFLKGKIYTGSFKVICAPGLNCYSCPGALTACPIGALQAVAGSYAFHLSLYVFGFLTAVGALLGRAVCGFLCPFGLIQDLLWKIPWFKKIRVLTGEKFLRLFRFFVLAVFVVLLPMVFADATGIGDPWYCKYICPAGTLEAGIPLVLMHRGLRSAVGFLYVHKLWILGAVILLSIVLYRPFCRYLCPLGAIYGFFNRFALYRYTVDPKKCISCGKCQKACGFDIPVWQKPNSMDCIRCGKCRDACPTGAIEVKKIK